MAGNITIATSEGAPLIPSELVDVCFHSWAPAKVKREPMRLSGWRAVLICSKCLDMVVARYDEKGGQPKRIEGVV